MQVMLRPEAEVRLDELISHRYSLILYKHHRLAILEALLDMVWMSDIT
jgi:hypothetical protein